MHQEHNYQATIRWTGNKGTGTSGYTAYERNHNIEINNKPNILGSSDPSFRGDKMRHNPEELFLSSLAACHMLWYLHLCAVHKVVVLDYVDNASGTMKENEDGSGYFSEVILNPEVTVSQKDMIPLAMELHDKANKMCYIANSLNFPIKHQPIAKTLTTTV